MILSYYRSETALSGVPLVLLFEHVNTAGWGKIEVYLLSRLAGVLQDLPPIVHDWMVSMLSEMSRNKKSREVCAPELFELYGSMSVGPLRTERAGSFSAESPSSSLAAIQKHCGLVPLCAEPGWTFPDLLIPLEYELLPLLRQKIWNDSDEALALPGEMLDSLTGTDR